MNVHFTRELDATDVFRVAGELKKVGKAVRRGVAWLDRKRPQWFDEVQPGSLNMRSGETCIIGQLFGDYADGLQTGVKKSTEWSERHGFVFNRDDDGHQLLTAATSYQILDAFWRAAIYERKAATGQVHNVIEELTSHDAAALGLANAL